MLSGSILIERQLRIMEIYSWGWKCKNPPWTCRQLGFRLQTLPPTSFLCRDQKSATTPRILQTQAGFPAHWGKPAKQCQKPNKFSSNIKSLSPLPWAEPPWTWPSSSEPLDSAWLPKLFQIPSPSTSAQLRREQNKTDLATYDLEFLESMTESLIDYRKNDKNSLSDFFFFFSNFPSASLPSPKFSVHTLSSLLALPSWEKNFRTSPEIRIFSLSHPPFPPNRKKLF